MRSGERSEPGHHVRRRPIASLAMACEYHAQRLESVAVRLRGAGVTDGAQLWVDPLTEAPPAAIVHDVSDGVSDDLGPALPVVALAVAGG